MTARDKDTLKGYFNKGDVPSEENFADLIDTIFSGSSLVLHANSHKYGGNDLIGTATPSANAIPMAGADGKLNSGWLPAQSQYDHGNLLGLGDDDHAQYLNITRHDSSSRHTLGTVVPHDDHGNLSGLGDDDHPQYALRIRSISAGDGLTGGGDLSLDRSFSLNTPGTLNVSSTNVATGNHSHAISSSSNPGISSSLLSTNTLGVLTLSTLEIINQIFPQSSYTGIIGSAYKKFASLYVGELRAESLVAQSTIATIGGRILIGMSNVLADDLDEGDISMLVKYNNLVSGDICVFETDGKLEWIKVLSAPSGSGPYSYSIERNFGGNTGVENFAKGDTLFNTGHGGSSFIDIYSDIGIDYGSGIPELGPTISGKYRYSNATVDAITTAWTLGNLNGSYGYTSDLYGAAFGPYQDNDILTIDTLNGIRFIDDENNVRGQLSSNIWTLGRVTDGEPNVVISTTGLSIRNNLTERIGLTSDGILTIKDSSGNSVITLDASSGAEFTKKMSIKGTNSAISIGVTPPTSATVGTGIWLDRTGFYSLASNVQQVKIDASTGQLLAGNGSLILDTNGLTLGAIPNSAARYITWKSYTTPIIDLTQIGASEEVIDPNWSLGILEFSAIGNSNGGSGYWNSAWGEMRFKVSNPIVNSYVTMTLNKYGLGLSKGADGGTAKIYTQGDIESAGSIYSGQTILLSTGIKIDGKYISASDGWTLADETWTYVSSSSFRISGNVVSKYPKGTKIKLTNSSIKYFYVINAVYSSPNTTITVTGGSDYTLANTTISSNYFSYVATPQDFPIWFNWSPSFTGYSANPVNGVYRFKVDGSTLHAVIREAFNGTSNAGSLTISAPVIAKTITNQTWLAPAVVVDNGNTVTPWSRGRIGSNESVFTFGTTSAIDGGFTSSNGKKVTTFSIVYEI